MNDRHLSGEVRAAIEGVVDRIREGIGDDRNWMLSSDDILDLRHANDAQLHPDGSMVVFTVSSGVIEGDRKHPDSRLWIVPADGSAPPRALTAEGTRAHAPQWSSDGTRLAFLGNRDPNGDDRLYLLGRGWGEAQPAFETRGTISEFAWAPDSASLGVLITDEQEQREDDGRDQIEYEHKHHFARIWRCDAVTGALTRLSDDDLHVWEFAWAPDGSELVALVSDEPYNWSWYTARLATLDVAGGGHFTTLHSSERQYTHPGFSPDGRSIAVITSTWSDHGMTGGDVLLIDRQSGAARDITEGHPRSYLSFVWEPDGERLFCAALEDGQGTLGTLTIDGAFTPLVRGPFAFAGWSSSHFSRDRTGHRIALVRSDPHQPADIWTIDPPSPPTWHQITTLNPTIAERRLAPVEALHWAAPDGLRIQGLLVRPLDAQEGRPAPMVVHIHGGPTSLWPYSFPGLRSMGWVQLLAAKGYAVLLPNPRGSMGFGLQYAEANVGDMGGGDLADILAGVDYCISQGIADTERLGVAGWSYGGYMTSWAVTQTTRFKAAVCGASITNWISFHGVSTIPHFDSVFYRTDPFNWDGAYGQFSPMAHVRNVRTPALFLHGEQDPICPVGQAYEMWRALKELDVETELVVYPREGHGMREREHARDVLERAVAWLSERV